MPVQEQPSSRALPSSVIIQDFWAYLLTPPSSLLLADRSLALWTLGYPEAALADAQRVAKDARDLGRVLAYAVGITSRIFIQCGDYAAANAQLDEAIAWTDEKGAVFWKAMVTGTKGCVFAMTGKPSDAVMAVNGFDSGDFDESVVFGDSLCGQRPI